MHCMMYVGKRAAQTELPDTKGFERTESRVDAFVLVSTDREGRDMNNNDEVTLPH